MIENYSWIPSGIGLFSYLILFIDVYIRRRVENATKNVLSHVQLSAPYLKQNTYNQFVAESSASPKYVATLSIMAALTGIVSLIGGLLVIGLNNSYETVLVDKEATSDSRVFVGFDLQESELQICGDGEDYWACVAMHNTMRNALCTGSNVYRTSQANRICGALEDFIEGGLEAVSLLRLWMFN